MMSWGPGWTGRAARSGAPRSVTMGICRLFTKTIRSSCSTSRPDSWPCRCRCAGAKTRAPCSTIEDTSRSPPPRRPFVVHRIDRDTSGLVLFAKSAAAQDHLKGQFKRHLPERVYQAVVYGHPSPASGTWRDHLVWDERSLIQKETHPRDPRGKEAISHYQVLEPLKGAALIEVRLVTGGRNQIRIQARLRGHTLVGEQRYIYGPDTLRSIAFPRQALHAHRLTFKHPVDGRELRFESPLPQDLVELIAR